MGFHCLTTSLCAVASWWEGSASLDLAHQERAIIICHSESVKGKSETAVLASPVHVLGLGHAQEWGQVHVDVSSVLSLHPGCCHTGCDSSAGPSMGTGPELPCGAWKRPYFLRLETQEGLVRRQNMGGEALGWCQVNQDRCPPYIYGRALWCHTMMWTEFLLRTSHGAPPTT